jgi:hypothetical protein
MKDFAELTYRATWCAHEKQYIGTCEEVPSASVCAESESAAIEGIILFVGAMQEAGIDVGKLRPRLN